MNRIFLSLFFLSYFLTSYSATLPDYSIEKSPKWKKQIGFQLDSIDFSNKGETSYLLVDWQGNESTREYNYHYCIRLNNENGVQDNSQLYFSFDPTYEKLTINKILIHRNGKTINQLHRNQIEIMRNEKNADRLIYDGTYSALVILNDVRVGDVLEYEYTLEGQNPIWGNHTYFKYQLAYDQEIQHLYKSTLLPVDQNCKLRLSKNAPKPVITTKGKLTRYEWDLKDVKPIFTDSSIPSWYQAYAFAEISSFQNWNEVKRWENDLFNFNIKTPQINVFLSHYKKPITDNNILEIIHFVQDDVRYLGMEQGVNSHKPHNPEKIFKQRFGDCKDKAYLLSVILRKLGVDAWPALVNTSAREHIEERIPSPFVFNHVIVKFKWKQQIYWVDATMSQTKGSLDNYCFPEYGKALVVDNGENDFDEIPFRNNDQVVIDENYWMKDSASEVRYRVETNYYGRFADSRRSSFKNSSLSEMKDSYMNFYSDHLDNVQWQKKYPLTTKDYPDANIFNVKEKMVLNEVWTKRNDDDPKLYATFNPFNMYEYLSYSKDRNRSMPLAIMHPISVDHTISVHFPSHKEIGLKNETDSVVNNAFRFIVSTHVDHSAHVYRVNYVYQTKADYVPVDHLKSYFKDYDRLSDLCTISINWGNDSSSGFQLYLPAFLLALLFAGFMIFLLQRLYKNDLESMPSHKSPLSFGGWLIFPMIGLHLSPLIVASQLIKNRYFATTSWNNLSTLYPEKHFLIESAYSFELLFNLGIILFSIFLLILMYQKRTTFPKIYIWFRIVVLAGLLLDSTIIANMFQVEAGYTEMARAFFNAAIWIPYMLFSERVKDTFTRTFSKPEKIQDEENRQNSLKEINPVTE